MTRFEDFFRDSYLRLFRVLVAVTTDRQDAEDVLQEAYSRAAADWDHVARLDSPEAWVRRVALNRALDLHKRAARRRRAYAQLHQAPAQLDELHVEIEVALRALRPEDRQVVVLHHLLGLTVAEISVEVRRPSGTVKTQLVRGRQQLAGLLRVAHEEIR